MEEWKLHWGLAPKGTLKYKKGKEIESFLSLALTRIEEETAEDICKIVDDIELSRLHTSLEGWRAFKGIRNAIRDKYILSPSEEKECKCHYANKEEFIDKCCPSCQEPKKGKK